tara:strand:- start:142 stop:324 length:183 start_codon:yes stop_codon:yes gene_type:complete
MRRPYDDWLACEGDYVRHSARALDDFDYCSNKEARDRYDYTDPAIIEKGASDEEKTKSGG